MGFFAPTLFALMCFITVAHGYGNQMVEIHTPIVTQTRTYIPAGAIASVIILGCCMCLRWCRCCCDSDDTNVTVISRAPEGPHVDQNSVSIIIPPDEPVMQQHYAPMPQQYVPMPHCQPSAPMPHNPPPRYS